MKPTRRGFVGIVAGGITAAATGLWSSLGLAQAEEVEESVFPFEMVGSERMDGPFKKDDVLMAHSDGSLWLVTEAETRLTPPVARTLRPPPAGVLSRINPNHQTFRFIGSAYDEAQAHG
jgi:hypothetical protein